MNAETILAELAALENPEKGKYGLEFIKDGETEWRFSDYAHPFFSIFEAAIALPWDQMPIGAMSVVECPAPSSTAKEFTLATFRVLPTEGRKVWHVWNIRWARFGKQAKEDKITLKALQAARQGLVEKPGDYAVEIFD